MSDLIDVLNRYMDRVDSLILMLKNNGIIDNYDMSYICGDITYTEMVKMKQEEERKNNNANTSNSL